ncbi:helix-turn-helix domain-containing protein [Haloactinospora alba]|uniref:helix-turn-helix domain-containing protein n=1 Tax=Haloactinospora alba TaxID=405555 RepID=UPI0014776BF8|nr:helix-turn-helix transcriptional regulator [Haloactinospora alba]
MALKASGTLIRRAREFEQMSRADVVHAIDLRGGHCTENHLARIERGERHPSRELLCHLARVIGTTPTRLSAEVDD